MGVEIRAVREVYRFAERAPHAARFQLLEPARKPTLAIRSSNQPTENTTRLDLSTRATRAESSGKLDSSQPARGSRGALYNLFEAIGAIGARIDELTLARTQEVEGSERHQAIENELAFQRQSLTRIIDGPVLSRMRTIFAAIDSALGQGVSRPDIARLLLGERSLLGDDFLGVVQQGDLSGLAGLRSGLSALQGIDPSAPDAASQLTQIAAAGRSALASKSYQLEEATRSPVKPRSTPVPLPTLTSTVMDLPGNASFALRSLTGKDVARAIEAHVSLDPEHALVLILDRTDTPRERSDRQERARAKSEELAQRADLPKPFSGPYLDTKYYWLGGAPESD